MSELDFLTAISSPSEDDTPDDLMSAVTTNTRGATPGLYDDIRRSRDRITKILQKGSDIGDVGNAATKAWLGEQTFGDAYNAAKAQRLKNEGLLHSILLKTAQGERAAAEKAADRSLRTSIARQASEDRRDATEQRRLSAEDRIALGRELGDNRLQIALMNAERMTRDAENRASERKKRDFGTKMRLQINSLVADPESRSALAGIIATDPAFKDYSEDDIKEIPGIVSQAIELAKARNPNFKYNAPSRTGNGPTLAQQASGDEIADARSTLRQTFERRGKPGETLQQFVARTSKTALATGRENPDHDPLIKGLFDKANKRRVGGDPDFELWRQFRESPKSQTQGHPTAQPAAPDVQESLRAAKEAIARGKDRDAVIQRLIENGIDPTGL